MGVTLWGVTLWGGDVVLAPAHTAAFQAHGELLAGAFHRAGAGGPAASDVGGVIEVFAVAIEVTQQLLRRLARR